jgi:hypothetical protein
MRVNILPIDFQISHCTVYEIYRYSWIQINRFAIINNCIFVVLFSKILITLFINIGKCKQILMRVFAYNTFAFSASAFSARVCGVFFFVVVTGVGVGALA